PEEIPRSYYSLGMKLTMEASLRATTLRGVSTLPTLVHDDALEEIPRSPCLSRLSRVQPRGVCRGELDEGINS
ncbi:MAG: hypothetical protein KAT23_06925, partial [Anaerolineales bacterium]|nr:hypothetical protein [Anaerolineales bacterium]